MMPAGGQHSLAPAEAPLVRYFEVAATLLRRPPNVAERRSCREGSRTPLTPPTRYRGEVPQFEFLQ
jgi:hypothetical protein